jgi:large subunit ribosomal protein L32
MGWIKKAENEKFISNGQKVKSRTKKVKFFEFISDKNVFEEEYMAVPKRRISSTRRDKRRTHFKIKPSAPALCSHCKQPKSAHRVCKNCGYYAGVEVVQPEE